MPKKSNQDVISAIKKLEKSLKSDLGKSFASKIEDTELALMVRIEERAEKTERVLREEILRVEEKVEKVDEKLDKKFDIAMTHIDGIAKGLDDMREENTAGADLIREVEVKVDDHEKRITSLESVA